jgi:hypothetical protein
VGKFLLAVALFAVLVYGLFWLLERRKRKAVRGRPVTPPKRVVAPDDDEDFLREIERRRRREAREGKGEEPDKPDGGPTDPGTPTSG